MIKLCKYVMYVLIKIDYVRILNFIVCNLERSQIYVIASVQHLVITSFTLTISKSFPTKKK